MSLFLQVIKDISREIESHRKEVLDNEGYAAVLNNSECWNADCEHDPLAWQQEVASWEQQCPKAAICRRLNFYANYSLVVDEELDGCISDIDKEEMLEAGRKASEAYDVILANI